MLDVKVHLDTQVINNLQAQWNSQGTALFPQKLVHCMREPWIWSQVHKMLSRETIGPILSILLQSLRQ